MATEFPKYEVKPLVPKQQLSLKASFLRFLAALGLTAAGAAGISQLSQHIQETNPPQPVEQLHYPKVLTFTTDSSATASQKSGGKTYDIKAGTSVQVKSAVMINGEMYVVFRFSTSEGTTLNSTPTLLSSMQVTYEGKDAGLDAVVDSSGETPVPSIGEAKTP